MDEFHFYFQPKNKRGTVHFRFAPRFVLAQKRKKNMGREFRDASSPVVGVEPGRGCGLGWGQEGGFVFGLANKNTRGLSFVFLLQHAACSSRPVLRLFAGRLLGRGTALIASSCLHVPPSEGTG
jgi:hypothetical protein